MPKKKTFRVWITRTSYANTQVEVVAKDEKEARKLALDKVGDRDFPGAYDADYVADNVEVVK